MKLNRLAYLLAFAFLISLVACKSDGTNQSAIANGGEPAPLSLSQLEAKYKETPNAANGNAVVNALIEKLKDKSISKTERTNLLKQGYDISSAQGIVSRTSGFLFSMLKEGGSSDPGKIFELGKLMKNARKEGAANVLFNSIVEESPDWEGIGEVKSMMTETLTSSDAYITTLGKKLFEDVDNTGINRTAAMKYVNACEAYAIAFPDNLKVTPDNLFKAAEVAKSIRTFPKSLSIYDWILEKYPNYEKAPTSLFLKGFIIENNIKDDVMAKEIYNKFLSDYPKHDLADDVQFLIDNLGKSDQEILEMIESKKKN